MEIAARLEVGADERRTPLLAQWLTCISHLFRFVG